MDSLTEIASKSCGGLTQLRKQTFVPDFFQKLRDCAIVLFQSIEMGGKIMIAGNGGSAADAQHIAAEFVGRFRNRRRPLPAIALTADTSVITALSNDFGYSCIFSRQIVTLYKPDDVVWLLTTSGQSENVLLAFDAAQQFVSKTIVMTGNRCAAFLSSPFVLSVPSNVTSYIQNIHIEIAHILLEMVEWLISRKVNLTPES